MSVWRQLPNFHRPFRTKNANEMMKMMMMMIINDDDDDDDKNDDDDK